MNSKNKYFLLFLMLAFVINIYNMQAEEKKGKGLKKTTKTMGTPIRTNLNINYLSTVLKNEGTSDIDRDEQNSGLVYPKGSGKTAVFESGFLWGAKIAGDDQVRVGGSAYSSGLEGGRILNSGVSYEQLVAESANDPKVRIYRVRPDVYPNGPYVDLSSEIQDNEGSLDEVRARYEQDWLEWPGDQGAPYTDVNNNKQYDNGVDIPGVPGADQTIWFVCNDLQAGKTADLYGTKPMGIEQQTTYWAYKRTDALGYMYFRKYRIENKSNTAFDSMYVSMWSDVDLGNATDDFAGCDTTLSLGYCYNANSVDATYNPLPPPAVGFDFFQGPLVKGIAGQDRNKNGVDDAADFGRSNGQIVGPGFINLPMTAFYYFANGDANVTDPTRSAVAGADEFYNFFQGRVGKTGEYFVDPNTGKPTPFVLTGDPSKRTGWIDGQVLPSGDRRMGLASGPFTMKPGDVQEIVVAEIVAGAVPGVDRLTAIDLLKYYDIQAQNAYDKFFVLTPPPPAPNVRTVEQDKEIVLDWSYDVDKVAATEGFNLEGYKFEGYNVYQLPSQFASIDQAKRIATFDLSNDITTIYDKYFDTRFGGFITAPVQYGNDAGIQRFLDIKNDELNGGTPLINGIRYFYAVTAYARSVLPIDSTFKYAKPQVLENTLSILTVVPHAKSPDIAQKVNFGSALEYSHPSGTSSAVVTTKIIDPMNIQGTDFQIGITVTDSVKVYLGDDEDPETNDTLTVPNPKWSITNLATNKVVFGPSTNFDFLTSNPVFDGVQIGLVGSPFYTPNKEIGSQTYEPADHFNWEGVNWGGNFFDGGLDLAGRFRASTLLPFQVTKNVEIRFNSSDGQKAYNFIRGSSTGGAPYAGFYQQPFKVFDVTDPNHPRQIDFVMLEANGSPKQDNVWAPSDNSGDREYFIIVDENYTDTEKPEYVGGKLDAVLSTKPGLYGGWYILKDASKPAYQNGDVWKINATISPSTNDKWTFSTKNSVVVKNSIDSAKQDVGKVNVYPNPYYGTNSEEINKYNRFVTFSHLPNKATIRLFNLAGVLVRTIRKEDASTFQRWDLANEAGLPVASGLYIAHIDMPDIGVTKILKVAIIQEQQILDRF